MLHLTEEERLLEQRKGKEKEYIKIVKNLLEQKVDINIIMQASGLFKEEIELLN